MGGAAMVLVSSGAGVAAMKMRRPTGSTEMKMATSTCARYASLTAAFFSSILCFFFLFS